jgi:hypothetical protein
MNFGSKFFNSFKYNKNSFKTFCRKDIFNSNKSSTYMLNKFQTVNYLSILTSSRLINASYFLNNINTSQTTMLNEETEVSTTELLAKEECKYDPITLLRMMEECVMVSMRRTHILI